MFVSLLFRRHRDLQENHRVLTMALSNMRGLAFSRITEENLDDSLVL